MKSRPDDQSTSHEEISMRAAQYAIVDFEMSPQSYAKSHRSSLDSISIYLNTLLSWQDAQRSIFDVIIMYRFFRVESAELTMLRLYPQHAKFLLQRLIQTRRH